MQPKIVFSNVTRRFDLAGNEFVALDRFSLDVADGEFVTVVGPSGCGKSTALNIAAGLLAPSEGEVLIDGKGVDGPGPERGMIFQQYALFPWLTVRQNVEFGLRIKGEPAARRRETAEHFIDLVGLGHFADALPKTLSGGMKQRCAIARAYAVNPSVLLMDEPFGALDAQTRLTMQELLLSVWQKLRTTVVFVTHDIDEAILLADTIYVMSARPGRIATRITVPIERPRSLDLITGEAFNGLKREILKQMRH